ncbi:MAG TPA: SOS response-associated peptidase [Flavobacteriales bacterium]|nr:SOS response-associated peptidase [Flavobacteriales bacterium]HMR27839.1 SOS response-associated peptidase [Flavobacteriales bacterium]
MCYSTTLDRDLKALEQRLNRRMIDEFKRGERPDAGDQLLLPLDRTSAFARPLWPVVASKAPDRISVQRWGLLPRYIRSEEEAQAFLKRTPTFNAISEEVDAKRSYTHAVESGQRCLVPVTGFFEWRHEGKVKVPYRIGLKGGDVFCLGGLWEEHDGADTYTVLTTRANPLMAFIHNSKQRMPVIVPEAQWDAWLSPDLAPAEVKRSCAPFPEEEMEAERLGAGPVQGTLF